MSAESVRPDPELRRVPRRVAAGRRRAMAGLPGGDDLDEPAELVFYCPSCAEREFGD
jgi:hypothetical protein